MPFNPHTADDVREMLAAIGAADVESLFDEIPADLRCGDLEAIPAALSEMEVGRLMSERAASDTRRLNFTGAGAYEHQIPAAVWPIVTRGEFYSAYTPYQAEASQGTLQLIYEFQSMMASLTGMAVSNASLYDGATSVAESCLMAVRANRKSKSRRILLPVALNPLYRKVVHAIGNNQKLAFELLPYDPREGRTTAASLEKYSGDDITALVIQQPNFFGTLEDVDALTNAAHEAGMMVIAVVNPTSLGILKPPGEWGERGADIVCGEGQPLGVPLSSGGPYFGFMTTRMDYVRQMPGRIVGRTVDLDGNAGFTLTLQAREQHIRRSKATSNICTNQGLMALCACIYMSIVGKKGISTVAELSAQNAHYLAENISNLEGFKLKYDSPFFNEFVVAAEMNTDTILDKLNDKGFYAGINLKKFGFENGLLIAVTEKRTKEEMDCFIKELSKL